MVYILKHKFINVGKESNKKYKGDASLTSSMYILCLSVCLSVRLYPINVKTAEPVWSIFFVWPCMTLPEPREGLWMIEFSKVCYSKNPFLKILKFHEIFFLKSATFFVGFQFI